MGWTFTHRDSGESDLDWFRREFGLGARLLDGATKGTTFYGAVVDGDGTTWALVCLIQRVPRAADGFNFGYKDMDESMGPGPDDCPERILQLLSDLPDDDRESTGWARSWRERCWLNVGRAAAAASIKPGAVVRFATPLHFPGIGCPGSFTFVGRSTFRNSIDGRRVRIPNWRTMTWEVDQ